MLLNRCKECGVPRVVRKFGRWNHDGTISARVYNDVLRICFIEQGEIRSIIDGISSRIGHPIDRIVAEGERRANRSSVDELSSRGGGILRYFGRSFLGTFLTVKVIEDIARGLGHGLAKVVEQKRGRLIRVRIRNPYSVPLVSGDLWGTYEANFSMTGRAAWKEEEDAVVVTIEKAQDGVIQNDPARLALKKMPTIEGHVEFDRCPRCRVPREMTRAVSWDIDQGIIVNKRTGRREVLVIVETINAIIRELTWELGDIIPEMVLEIVRDYTAGQMADVDLGNSADDYQKLLDGMRVFGMGNPVEVSKDGVLLTVRIDNPACEPILAGRVAGYYQVLEGTEPEVKWTPDTDGYIFIQVQPA